MIGVLIIPTGIEAAIGGHAGDANPLAKLMGACCDTVITHPNVVNASDINEMPPNALYVEGSMLDRFLEGEIGLAKPRQNRILVAVNPPIRNDTINAVSAARATIGIKAEILELPTPLKMAGSIKNGKPCGFSRGVLELVQRVLQFDFDALAIHTPIDVDRNTVLKYYDIGGPNPWGWIEAQTSRQITESIAKPTAHAPLENASPDDPELYNVFNQVVDPRIAAEAISSCYLHSVLKGLHMAPRIGNDLTFKDVDFMLSPRGCYGRPHHACYNNGIPVIMVEENHTLEDCLISSTDKNVIFAKNYWEAAGIIMSMKAAIDPASVRRPLAETVLRSA